MWVPTTLLWFFQLDNPVRTAKDLLKEINKCVGCRAALVQDPGHKSTILNHLKDEFLKKLKDLPMEELSEVVLVCLGDHGMYHDSNVLLIPTVERQNVTTRWISRVIVCHT